MIFSNTVQRYYIFFNHAIYCMINFRLLYLFNTPFHLHYFPHWQIFARQLARNCKPTGMRCYTRQKYERNIKLYNCIIV